nr:serine/arginine repetitive matrix protein 1-like [Penaeus vannamei]
MSFVFTCRISVCTQRRPNKPFLHKEISVHYISSSTHHYTTTLLHAIQTRTTPPQEPGTTQGRAETNAEGGRSPPHRTPPRPPRRRTTSAAHLLPRLILTPSPSAALRPRTRLCTRPPTSAVASLASHLRPRRHPAQQTSGPRTSPGATPRAPSASPPHARYSRPPPPPTPPRRSHRPPTSGPLRLGHLGAQSPPNSSAAHLSPPLRPIPPPPPPPAPPGPPRHSARPYLARPAYGTRHLSRRPSPPPPPPATSGATSARRHSAPAHLRAAHLPVHISAAGTRAPSGAEASSPRRLPRRKAQGGKRPSSVSCAKESRKLDENWKSGRGGGRGVGGRRQRKIIKQLPGGGTLL